MRSLVLGTFHRWSPGFFKPHSSCFIHDVSIRWVSGTGGVETADLIHGCPTALEMVLCTIPDAAWGYHSFFGSKPWIFMQSEMPIYQDTEYFVAGPSRWLGVSRSRFLWKWSAAGNIEHDCPCLMVVTVFSFSPSLSSIPFSYLFFLASRQRTLSSVYHTITKVQSQ